VLAAYCIGLMFVCLGLGVLAGCGNRSRVAGTWTGLGTGLMTVKVTLNADNTGSAFIPEYHVNGPITWKEREPRHIVMFTPTARGMREVAGILDEEGKVMSVPFNPQVLERSKD
jgi:hypothetical protein